MKDNFKLINEKEYDWAKKNLHSLVLNSLYEKEMNGESPIFSEYSMSLENKEKLYYYFSKDRINNKLNNDNENYNIFKKQIESIDNIIKPVLDDLGIPYQLILTGGSLRDHLLDKPIKDLDILIEFNDPFEYAMKCGHSAQQRQYNFEVFLEKFFKEKRDVIEKHGLLINANQSRERILHEIIFQTVKKADLCEVESFFGFEGSSKPKKQDTETIEEEPIYNNLFSVLKIKNDTLTYPIDLLLNSSNLIYLNSFDFNICKCSYTFKSLDEQSEPLCINTDFIKDVIESKLSLNVSMFSNTKQVDKCLKDHYLRIVKKYPTHQFELVGTNSTQEIIDYIVKSQQYYSLEFNLKNKENAIKQKIKKI